MANIPVTLIAGTGTASSTPGSSAAIFVISIGAAFAGILAAATFWLVVLPAGRVLVVRVVAPKLG